MATVAAVVHEKLDVPDGLAERGHKFAADVGQSAVPDKTEARELGHDAFGKVVADEEDPQIVPRLGAMTLALACIRLPPVENSR